MPEPRDNALQNVLPADEGVTLSSPSERYNSVKPSPVVPASSPFEHAHADDSIQDPVLRTIDRLIGGKGTYTLAQAAVLTGLQEGNVRRFWQAMGFPFIADESRPIFTSYDIDVLKAHAAMMDHGLADQDTLNSLVRAQSHFADRMVLWQYEALVEEFEGRFEQSEVDARHNVLEHIDDYEEFFLYQMRYAWRRHMAALMRRAQLELEGIEQRSGEGASGQQREGDTIELQRALGFVDLVSFTHASGQMSPHALVDFVQTFEFTCRDVITTYGARVVKMVGDAVLYIADDLDTGVQVVNHVVKALADSPNMPDVRASLVWGGVVSRFGDVFGSTVNLASRLCNVAPVNGILVDHATAEALFQMDPQAFSIQPYSIPELEGIGAINAAQVTVLKHRDLPTA